ncbi:MAG: hypothetical protein K0R46_78 [Herbinix sp.]|jgi:dihydrofolate synthase/folylpolyglutamate synthase|nr:hypothetical protein [Herbinix sp.]
MTYKEAREYIEQAEQYGNKLGLELITELLIRLGNPQDKVKVIHVAGTNGKGSTTSYLASILAMGGYKVGRYISPTVFSYRERIQISGLSANHEVDRRKADPIFANQGIEGYEDWIITEYITRQGVSDAISAIKTACEAMVEAGWSHPTPFELETAMAFLYFEEQQVDFAVVEVGLGGRLDATNVMKQPVCCVITSISMDHMQYLGDTLAKITEEKAGIIKYCVPVITCNTTPEVWQTLEERCKERKAPLILADSSQAEIVRFSPEETVFQYQGEKYKIQLLGKHQISNAVLALQTVEVLIKQGYPIGSQAILWGLKCTKWSGRFEIIAQNPYFIIDGAHNEDAALKLADSIKEYFPDRRMIYIIGVFADKDYHRILQITAPLASLIITLTSKNSRALT